jgi:hypothetical protein
MIAKKHILPGFAIILGALLLFSCNENIQKAAVSATHNISRDSSQMIFWQELHKLCGKTFEGEIVSAPANDTVFANQRLIMHVRSCEPNVIQIPFFVGSDRSRTWVLTLDDQGILLKHDHRHSDGTPDELTMYGGKTVHFGSANLQVFPADQETVNMLPPALTNVWWIGLSPGEFFTYNLRRVNTDRLFTVRFDLTREVDLP